MSLASPVVTRGPHFFLDPADIDTEHGRAVLRGAEAHHLATVLRAEPGQPVSLADGTGTLYQGRVRKVERDEVSFGIDEGLDRPDRLPRLTVVHALPAGRKLDEVVRRLTEIGVDRLVPVRSTRSEVTLSPTRATKVVARWRSVALAGAKQSRRAKLMEVAEVGEWATAFPAEMSGAVLWEEATVALREVLHQPAGAEALVLGIGPEGGLTAEEATGPGLPTASLGPTLLRTETAALVAAAAVLTLAGRLA